MDITIIVLLFIASLLVIWTSYGLLFIIALFKIINCLKGWNCGKSVPSVKEAYFKKVEVGTKEEEGGKGAMSADELAAMNARLDTEVAQKSATREEEGVVVHIGDLANEETLEG